MRIAIPPPNEPAYKPLKTHFRSKGFDYVQRDRIGDVALFEQSKEGLSRSYFEVVIVQRHGDYEIGGSKVEAAETMPSTSVMPNGSPLSPSKPSRDPVGHNAAVPLLR